MSNIGNKETMAKNLKYYIEKSGKTQKELAEIVNVSTSSFNDWVKAKKYPRIDKIEILADYFGILKSDLIEEKLTRSGEEENDIIADAMDRMEKDKELFATVERLMYDKEFFEVVKLLGNLKKEKLNAVKELLQSSS